MKILIGIGLFTLGMLCGAFFTVCILALVGAAAEHKEKEPGKEIIS